MPAEYYATLCSTPFGITEYIGHFLPGNSQPRREVLNAFRHHGVYRTARRTFLCARRNSAQRLSASRSISADKAPYADRRLLRVLNAFRHHGVYRGSCSWRWATRCASAQRLSASRSISVAPCAAPCAARRACSTPFGITEYIGTIACDLAMRYIKVLNAFRHHGVYRARVPPTWSHLPKGAQRLSASRSISARRSPALGPSKCSAQRLSASRSISGRRAIMAGMERLRVLNAFRHHGVYRAPARYCCARRPGCAQRLSASRSISGAPSPRPYSRAKFGAQRLSASRSISAHAPRDHGPYRRSVLNAFRHHGVYRSA